MDNALATSLAFITWLIGMAIGYYLKNCDQPKEKPKKKEDRVEEPEQSIEIEDVEGDVTAKIVNVEKTAEGEIAKQETKSEEEEE